MRTVRYGDFARELSLRQQVVSYGALTPGLERDRQGAPIPYRPPPIRLGALDAYRLLGPYVGVRLADQLRAVLPLVLYLVLFQLLILRQNVADAWVIGAGMVAVVVGLMLFMEGLKLGLMPFGEEIGHELPRKRALPTVLGIAFVLGIGVTFAEPAIGALQAVGAIVDPVRAPYLWLLLNPWAGNLVMVVGIGVGLAAVLGTLRFLHGWSLKPFIYLSIAPLLAVTLWCMGDPDLAAVLGLAWDCGAVTTGPVTVPLVLSLGIGIAAAGGKGDSSLSGFGIVTLASLFPVMGVLLLALYVSVAVPPEAVAALVAGAAHAPPSWFERTPWAEITGGLRAIVPLVVFLYLVLRLLLGERVREPNIVAYGLVLCVLGMIVFNLGLSYGLALLGGQSGGLVPAAFTELAHVAGSPLYGIGFGVGVALFFAFVLGFGATLAEPALNALGMTVENLTNGAFRKRALLYAVSIGVGAGIALGVLKIILDIPIGWLIVPGYLAGLGLTALSSEEFVNVAWDSAGVTTGPVTVPLVLAMGLGFGEAMAAVDGFGILSMASIGPILSVLVTGLYVQMRARRALADEAEG